MVQYPELDLPCLGPESWTVREPCVEPSTLEVDIADGSGFRAGPSTLEVDIADGSMSKAGPSTLVPRIADSSGIRC